MLPIRRNIALLSSALAANAAMLQLTAAVAATAELSERTAPSERGSLLGFNDLVSAATGAGLTLLGGVALTAGGVAALAIGAVVLVISPAVWILRGGPRRHASQMDNERLRRRPCTSTRGRLNLETTR
jgi:hypothetical protein